MKTRVILLLSLGLVGVIATPVSIVEAETTVEGITPLLERIESQTSESTPNKSEAPQSNVNTNEDIAISEEIARFGDADVDIIIEENVDVPHNDFVPQTDSDFYLGDNEFMVPNNDLFLDSAKVPDEIMDTAAGFVPIPIIKKRQKPSRRFATRRIFKKNPYRRIHHYYYPYYPYYPSYYPYHSGSLRYY